MSDIGNHKGNTKQLLEESLRGATLSLGVASIPLEPLARFLSKRSASARSLGKVPLEEAAACLMSAVSWILADRVRDGVAAGGWGHSDMTYMSYLYGNKEEITDSVSTTTVVMEALTSFVASIESLETWKPELKQEWWEYTIRQGVRKYAVQRWNPRTGEGGTLKVGAEGDRVVAPRYRHTAWLIRLWLILPGCLKNLEKTTDAMIEGFKFVEWDSEKVATPIAAYTALRELARRDSSTALISSIDVKYRQEELIDLVKQQFKPELHGWTSGIALEKGRNIYTLFVLAELAEDWNKFDDCLRQMMNDALRHTVENVRTDADGCCFVMKQDDSGPDLNSSCLAFAAISRKPSLTHDDRRLYENLAGFLIRRFARLSYEADTELYSWTLAYFVRALCDVLAGRIQD